MRASSFRRVVPRALCHSASWGSQNQHQYIGRAVSSSLSKRNRTMCTGFKGSVPGIKEELDEVLRAGDVGRVGELVWKLAAIDEKVCVGNVYNSILKACAVAGNLSGFERFHSEMQEKGIKCNPENMAAIIETCADKGELLIAEIWLNRMQALNVSPQKETFDKVIRSCTKAGNVLEAERWFETMNELGVTPDAETLNQIISVYLKGGDYSRLREWVTRMRQNSKVLEAKIYSGIIDACARESAFEEIEYWIEETKRIGILLNRNNYRILVSAFARANSPNKASELLHAMLKQNMEPDGNIFAYVIDAYVRSNNPEAASSWLERAIATGRANIQCFTPLARWYGSQQQPQRVLRLVDQIEACNIKELSRDFYMVVLKALALVNGQQHIKYMMKIIRKMREKRLLDTGACNLVLSAVKKFVGTSSVMRIFEELSQYVEPNSITCTIVMKNLEQSPPELAMEFMLDMLLKYGVTPTTADYNSLIISCVNARDFQLAKKMFISMVNSRVNPNVETFCTLISGHAKRGDRNSAQKWFNVSVKYGYGNSSEVLYSVVEAFFLYPSRQGKVERKKQALHAMNWLRSTMKGIWLINQEGTEKLVRTFLVSQAEPAAEESLQCFIDTQKRVLAKKRSSLSVAEMKSGTSISANIRLRTEVVQFDIALRQILSVFIRHFYSVKDENNVAKWLDKALKLSTKLSPNLFSMAIGLHIKKGNTQEARRRFMQMFELGVPRTLIIYRQIASISLCSSNKSEEQLIRLMKQDGISPNIRTFIPMLGNAANRAREGHSEAARVSEILRLMKAENIKPDELCSRYALEALSRDPNGKKYEMIEKELMETTDADTRAFTHLNANRVDTAFLEVFGMMKRGQNPSEALITRLLQSLVQNNKREEAENLYYLSNPTHFDFTVLGLPYAHAGDVKKVLELLSYLSKTNPSDIDLGCIHIVLHACYEAKDTETARTLLEILKKENLNGKESTKQQIKFYLRSLLGKEAEKSLKQSFDDDEARREWRKKSFEATLVTSKNVAECTEEEEQWREDRVVQQ